MMTFLSLCPLLFAIWVCFSKMLSIEMSYIAKCKRQAERNHLNWIKQEIKKYPQPIEFIQPMQQQPMPLNERLTMEMFDLQYHGETE